MYGGQYAARLTVELVFRLCVAYLPYGVARHSLQVYVGVGAHLAHYYHLSGGHESLDGTMRMLVVCQKLVEQRVRYLVSHLVGVSLRY